MSFFDFYDDGKLDLLVNVAQTDSLGNTYFRVQPVYNNIAYDTFFMQVRVLAGSNR